MYVRKIATVALLFFRTAAFAQGWPGKVDTSLLPLQYAHYMPEYAWDVPVNQQAWAEQTGGLHVSFVSTDRAWFRAEAPQLKETDTWKAAGWRGERLNTQLLLWSP